MKLVLVIVTDAFNPVNRSFVGHGFKVDVAWSYS